MPLHICADVRCYLQQLCDCDPCHGLLQLVHNVVRGLLATREGSGVAALGNRMRRAVFGSIHPPPFGRPSLGSAPEGSPFWFGRLLKLLLHVVRFRQVVHAPQQGGYGRPAI